MSSYKGCHNGCTAKKLFETHPNMMIQCVPYKVQTNTVKHLFYFYFSKISKTDKLCKYSRSDNVPYLHKKNYSYFRGVLQHSKNFSAIAGNSLFCVVFKVLQASWFLLQFPSNNSDCLDSGDGGSEILCPTMRLPKKSCKKNIEARNPFHYLPAQQRTESKNLINFSSKHISLKVSRRQNSIPSFRAESLFTL
jgi:hypothetical protein